MCELRMCKCVNVKPKPWRVSTLATTLDDEITKSKMFVRFYVRIQILKNNILYYFLHDSFM